MLRGSLPSAHRCGDHGSIGVAVGLLRGGLFTALFAVPVCGDCAYSGVCECEYVGGYEAHVPAVAAFGDACAAW